MTWWLIGRGTKPMCGCAPTLAYFHWRAMTVERAKFSKSGTGVIWLRMLVICSVNR